MNSVTPMVLGLVLTAAAFASIGCSEDSTSPDENEAEPRALDHLWSMRAGDHQEDGATGVTVDGSGNVFVVGYFNGTVNFGGEDHTSTGILDMFVASFTPTGTHRWSRRFGGSRVTFAGGIAIDGSGNMIIAGAFEGSVDFGGGELVSEGSWDIYVAAFDPTGAFLWNHHFGDEFSQGVSDVAVDGSGNIMVAGFNEGTVDFGGGELGSAGSYDAFVAAFNSAGGHLWSRGFGDSAFQAAGSIAVDESGNTSIAGYFDGTVNLGGEDLASIGFTEFFIASFDLLGNHRWSRQSGRAGNVTVNGSSILVEIAVDGAGNTSIAGHFQGTLNFGGGDLTTMGDEDIFVASFDATGNHRWSRRGGNAERQRLEGVAVDDFGNVFVTGDFDGAVNFGGGSLTSEGNGDTFVASFSPTGSHRWSQRFGGRYSQLARDVAVDNSGHVVVVGLFGGVANFGGTTLTSAGDADIFIAGFQPRANE